MRKKVLTINPVNAIIQSESEREVIKMSFYIGFPIFCVVLAIAMEHAPSWVYGAILTAFEKIME